ncbi:MAG: type II toxin-antitoxin system RelE/ParE family toxin [Proteobacteria bacterium]|nr:type II toxin-antitoxin system RelE/ParE family toxin [Pseudomonadota bacterium]
MRIFKTKGFHRWAGKEGLTDTNLVRANGDLAEGIAAFLEKRQPNWSKQAADG